MTRYLRDSTEDIERINIREMETYYELEVTILDRLEAQSKLSTRELEMGKVRLELSQKEYEGGQDGEGKFQGQGQVARKASQRVLGDDERGEGEIA